MIEKELNDGILTLRLAHGRASALDIELLEALTAALDDVGDARAIILTGTDGIFSAGVDLKRILEGKQAYAQEFVPLLDLALEKLFICPKPVVAAINGHAIAGGGVLAMACDYRIMASGKARIGVPEMRVGVPFPVSALEALRFALPGERLQSVIYQALTYPPEQALNLGMVDELVEADTLAARAGEVAAQFAAIPAETFAISKTMLREDSVERIKAQRQTHGKRILDCWSHDETYTQIQAFVKKTMG